MSFARLLSEAIASEGLPRTGDVLAVALPLLSEIAELHEQGLVAGLTSTASVTYDGTSLRLVDRTGSPARLNEHVVRELNPATSSAGIELRARHNVDLVVGQHSDWKSGDVHELADPAPRPMMLVGYRCWEQDHGHHDPLSDLAVAGLLITSFATGLDLDSERDVHVLAGARRQLTTLNNGLHPVVANVLSELIDPDRHQRPPEVGQVITRLEHHRELPSDLDLSHAYSDVSNWRHGVLSTLRDRVFDTTRRNRALYFRPSATTVSLTEASVPLLLNVERIKPDDLFTWTSKAATKLQDGATVDLEQWCRFEESPHVAPALDKLISNERKLRNEQGHGRLRLIIAFLRWFDLQNDEVVHSPLLLMPVRLDRRKGVKKRYKLSVDGDAVVNPILRFVFQDRFGIALPASIEPDVASIKAFVGDLEQQVQATAPEVGIEIIEKPRIDLLRRRAQLRVDTYRRNRARTKAATGRWRRISHSYDSSDWRPLGLMLYQRFVESNELPLRSLAGAPPVPRSAPSFTETATTGPVMSGADATRRESDVYVTVKSEVHRHRWEVDLCAVTLASLGSRRTTLSRDYDELLDRLGQTDAPLTSFDGSPFDELFSPEVSSAQPEPAAAISIDQQLVLPADDAQARAVRRAVRGDSFIIQGPPGTGKSQTITNVIAALVAEGKRVLFVCEKRAALDVVGHRLRQVGLGELVATIHDSQLDRRAFVKALGDTYNQWISATAGSSVLEERAGALADIATRLQPLEHLVRDLGRPRLGSSSVAELIERSVLLRSTGAQPADSPGDSVRLEAWFAARPILDGTSSALAHAGLSPVIGAHGALKLQPSIAAQPDPVSTAVSVGRGLQQALASLRSAWPSSAVSVDAMTLQDLRAVERFGPLVDTVTSHGASAALDPSAPQYQELLRSIGTIAQAEQALVQSSVPSRWKTLLTADDARNGLAIAQAQENSFFKFLNGGWRSLKKTLDAAYDFSQHSVAPPYSSVLQELVEHHERADAMQAAIDQATATYGVADLVTVQAAVEEHKHNPVFAAMIAHPGAASSALTQAVSELDAVVAKLIVPAGATVADVDAMAAPLLATSVAHEHALIAWASASGAGTDAAVDPAVLAWVTQSDKAIAEMELRLVEDAVAQLLRESQATLHGGAEIDNVVAELTGRYRRLLDLNAQAIESTTRDRFLAHVSHSEASMAGRSDQDKAFKRSYNAGRRTLEREFAKKMRFRSIRELADGDTGLVVRDLRPIWLMSPLSVSDTLPLDASMFDAVVFDEASQIPVEDAIPSTFRSSQVIVVGDRMQLPPTRFFSSTNDGDDEIEASDDGQSVTIALDADSFLTQADQTLSSTMLTWHYRSRFESLIAYSNAAFYEGSLATVPDLDDKGEPRSEIVVDSSDDATALVGELLARPISFHKVTNGVYRSRANAEEADYIAELVRALLNDETGLTIGVVAFSEAQQTAIETSLSDLALIDDTFAELLDAERNRTEDGEFLGLFVKNLENVQGDERDIIILSVCYAPGEDGKMRMNFGPINQAGGERRLNVIFSRAKRHMAVISTIDGDQITNTHNDGAAHLANFLQYAAAESVGDASRASALLNTQLGGRATISDQARSAIAEQIAKRLAAVDLSADVSVGRSQFTIDVAVRRDGVYQLGILVDPDEDADPTVRFIAEAGVLDAFDWPILRVTPVEWWSDPDRVINRITHRLATG